ncbi:MAG TPA: PilZ domain-containing protein [Mesorhizobium sp.]|nr:PilZ domain-containing protein [Mesorhizobium sp.]
MVFNFNLTAFNSRRDLRRGSRRKVNAPAWLRLGDGIAARECTIVNISSSGVQLRIDPAIRVADQFVFLKSRGEYPGRRCRVIWRRGANIGAEFV